MEKKEYNFDIIRHSSFISLFVLDFVKGLIFFVL